MAPWALVSVRILNPIQNRKTARGKLSMLDVLATDETGRILNVEVQTWLPQSMEQWIVYYTARSYVDQLQKGQNCSALRPSISICILAEPLFSDPAGLHLDFRLREKRSHRTLTDDLQIHLLQLPYFQVTAETVYNASDEERWLMFLRDADKLTTEQIRQLFPDKEFAEAAGVPEMIAKTPEERMEYEARLKYRRDQAGRRQQALMEGRELGLVEGRAEGRQEGRITLMQELPGLPISTPDELAACDANQLNQLAANLQQQLKARGFWRRLSEWFAPLADSLRNAKHKPGRGSGSPDGCFCRSSIRTQAILLHPRGQRAHLFQSPYCR